MPFALAAGVAAIVIARAVFTPAPVRLEAPAPAVLRGLSGRLTALADAPSAGQPAEEPVATPGVRVMLRCEGTTWAEATPDGAQQRRYELGPGQNLVITAREKLSLSLGDAGVIRLRVNERELGFIGDKGEMKIGLSFTAAKILPRRARCRCGDRARRGEPSASVVRAAITARVRDRQMSGSLRCASAIDIQKLRQGRLQAELLFNKVPSLCAIASSFLRRLQPIRQSPRPNDVLS